MIVNTLVLNFNETVTENEKRATVFKRPENKFLLLERQDKLDMQSNFSLGDTVYLFGKQWKAIEATEATIVLLK